MPNESEGSKPSLVDAQATGGKTALDGFDFQHRYALIWLIKSLADPDFCAILFEGAEDVEARFDRQSGTERHAVQVKNHRVTTAKAKEIIDRFLELDAGSPGTWTSFSIACTELDKTIGAIHGQLSHFRTITETDFYSERSEILLNTRDHLHHRISQAGLPAPFVMERVSFEPDLQMYSQDEWVHSRALHLLQGLYPQIDYNGAQIVYLRLCKLVADSTGKVITPLEIKMTIQPELSKYSRETAEVRVEQELRYRSRLAQDCRYLETGGVDRARPELTDIFVMLEALETPRPAELTDIAPLPERAEEMGLPGSWAGHGRHQEEIGQDPAHLQPPSPVPLSATLKKHEHLVILGEPGTGKSTTLQFLALCFARAAEEWTRQKLALEDDRIPVRIELREYDGKERLDRFLVHWLDRRYVPQALAQAWLDEGRLAILLDGLDEVPQQSSRDVVRTISSFAASPAGRICRIVVTSRIAGYQRLQELRDFGHYTICPFAGPEDALPYTAGWLKQHKGLADEEARREAQALLDEMEGLDSLRRVRSNPLLLRLAVAVYAESGQLARSRFQVYRRYVEEVVWDSAGRQQELQWSRQSAVQALEAIAWALQIHGPQTGADLAQAIAGQVDGVPDPHRLVDYLRERLGLLAVYDYQHGELLAFRHLSFREYFVARRLARFWEQDEHRESVWRFLQPRLHHPQWREPLLLSASMLDRKNATELVKRVAAASSPYERQLHRDLLLAAAVLSDAPGIDGATAGKLADRLVSLRLDVVQKPAYLFLLPVMISLLLAAGLWLFAPVPLLLIPLTLLVWWGLWAVATAGYWTRLDWIFSYPLRWRGQGDYPGLRNAVTQALAQLPETQRVRAAAPLQKGLLHQDKKVRWAAALALKDLGPPAAAILLRVLDDDQHIGRQAAAQALGELGDPRAIPSLGHALQDADRRLRWYAVWALGKIAGTQAVDPLAGALSDPDPGVREQAAEALGQIGASTAVDDLLLLLDNGHEADKVRAAAAESLGLIGDPRALDRLIEALADEEERVRTAAVTALGEMGDPRAGPPITHSFLDQVYDYGPEVPKALAKLADPHTTEPLIRALDSTDSRRRWLAALCLARVGDRLVLPFLTRALSNARETHRDLAAQCLGWLGDRQSVPLLEEALQDESISLRGAAAVALGEIGDASAVQALVRMLEDEFAPNRAKAAKALGSIADRSAVQGLSQALGDADWTVCSAAAAALAKIGDRSATPSLIAALGTGDSWLAFGRTGARDPHARGQSFPRARETDRWFKQAVLEALAATADPRAVGPVSRQLENPDYRLRWTAAGALEALATVVQDQSVAKKIARRLWRRLADQSLPQMAAFSALAQVVARSTQLEVASRAAAGDFFQPKAGGSEMRSS